MLGAGGMCEFIAPPEACGSSVAHIAPASARASDRLLPLPKSHPRDEPARGCPCPWAGRKRIARPMAFPPALPSWWAAGEPRAAVSCVPPFEWRFSGVGAEALIVRPDGDFVGVSLAATLRGCGCRSQASRQATVERRRGRHGPPPVASSPRLPMFPIASDVTAFRSRWFRANTPW